MSEILSEAENRQPCLRIPTLCNRFRSDPFQRSSLRRRAEPIQSAQWVLGVFWNIKAQDDMRGIKHGVIKWYDERTAVSHSCAILEGSWLMITCDCNEIISGFQATSGERGRKRGFLYYEKTCVLLFRSFVCLVVCFPLYNYIHDKFSHHPL